MQRLYLSPENIDVCAQKAASILADGGIVLYPTDTLYGLGADAFSDAAVAKIYRIKGRQDDKPIHAIVSDISMAEKYGEISNVARKLLEGAPRGLLSLVVKKHNALDAGIAKNIPTFGFRIPDHEFCIAMVKALGKPITATSANAAGEKPQMNVDAILKQLGDAAGSIDLVIDAGELPPSKPSTVVDISGMKPKIIREGAVLGHELHEMTGVQLD